MTGTRCRSDSTQFCASAAGKKAPPQRASPTTPPCWSSAAPHVPESQHPAAGSVGTNVASSGPASPSLSINIHHRIAALPWQTNWMSICEKDVLHQFRVGLPSQLHFYHDLSLVCNQAASLLPLPPRMIFLPWRVLKQSNFEARSAHHTRMRWALPCIVGGTNWK